MLISECHLCGSDKIIPDAKVLDHIRSDVHGDLSVAVDRKPDALILKGRVYGSVRAWICGECGHVELYVTNPEELYEMYLLRESSA